MKRALAVLLLAACAPQAPVFKPVIVDVPVATPCRAAPFAAPDFALSHVTPAQDIFLKTKAALVELDQRKGFEAALNSQLSSCQ